MDRTALLAVALAVALVALGMYCVVRPDGRSLDTSCDTEGRCT